MFRDGVVTDRTGDGAVVSRLALHLEVDAIGSLGLDLKVGCSRRIALVGAPKSNIRRASFHLLATVW